MPSWRIFLTRPWLLAGLPLLFFPFMINVRVFPFIAPNEEPKWILLMACFLFIAIMFALILWFRREPIKLRFHWSVFALIGFYTLLFVGIWLGPNTTEGMIRFAFWMACLTVWLAAVYGQRTLPHYMDGVCWLVSLGSLVFSIRYWFGYIDYSKPHYNISVLFSPIGHINFTGDVLVVLVPVIAWMLGYYKQPVLRLLNWVSLVSMLTMLLVASSRGALGGMAAGALVFAVIALRHHKLPVLLIGSAILVSVIVLLNWVSLVSMLTMLLVASSPGALGGMAAGALVFAVIALRHHKLVRQTAWLVFEHYFPVLLIGSAMLVSVIVYYQLPFHYRDLARVSATFRASADIQPGNLTPDVPQPPLAEIWDQLRPVLGTRTPIYASSSAMIADAPWLGQGTGNFFTVYPAYSNHFPDFRDPLSSARTFTTNPHNAILQITTQNGFIALFLFTSLLLLFWFRLMAKLWREWNPWHASGVMAITAALFDAMFNHVFFNPASMFVFAFFGALWWGSMAVLPATKNITLNLGRVWARPLTVGVMVFALLLCVWPARWAVSEYYAGEGMMYMRYPVIAAQKNSIAYDWDKDNFRALFGVAQAAYQEKRFADAVAYLKHFEKIYPYNAPALNMLAAAYILTGDYTHAKATLERTLATLPDFEMAQQNLQRVNAALQQRSLQLQRQKIAAQQRTSQQLALPR
ncbi:MAG: O-antigen ligase family protein [Mariprofundaceae bacterium]|nr:O-antigen ligase family protein [Mariprofundaceae bacterium]